MMLRIASARWRVAARSQQQQQGRFFSKKPPVNLNDSLASAAAGKLTHKDHIPKLASRVKHVAKLEHQTSRSGRQAWDKLGAEEGGGVYASGGGLGDGGASWGSGSGSGSDIAYPASSSLEDTAQTMALLLTQYANDERYYWNEEDYDEKEEEEDATDPLALDDSSTTETTPPPQTEDEDPPIDDEADPTAEVAIMDDDDPEGEVEVEKVEYGERKPRAIDPYEKKWLEYADIMEALGKNENEDPLQNMSPDQEAEFRKNLFTIKEGIEIGNPEPVHMYSSEKYVNLHPDSEREPIPHTPKNRSRVPTWFVEKYRRFIFISGFAPLEFNTDLANPVHQNLLQKSVAKFFDVDSSQVWPTSLQSAFVGFNTPEEALTAVLSGPSPEYQVRPPMFSTLKDEMAEEHSDFVKSKENTLLMENLPKRRYTSPSLLRDLFPPKSEIGDAYKSVTQDDIKFVSSSQALIRFQSLEETLSILQQSKLLTDRLQVIGQYNIQMFRARRELKHKKFGPFPLRREIRKLGHRLIVDGDMPTRPFYLSHAECLMAVNVDPSWTAVDISRQVQDHCTTKRDPTGSVEFVKCERGTPTGQVYIGFDLPGEAEVALKALGPTVRWGDRMAVLKLVRRRKYPHQKYKGPERRLDRPTEEVLNDLDNWEKFVDPKDLQTIYDAGITKEVLNDALRVVRYGNPTFGPLDSAMRDESLEPEKETGQQYRDLVKLYIELLIECLPNPDAENPEDQNIPHIYKSLFRPDEEIDMGIFEQEKRKQEAQAKFRLEGPQAA